jgi:hypothetical protein
MFAALKSYGIGTSAELVNEPYVFSSTFTAEDGKHLIDTSIGGSFKSKSARRKLIIAITEDADSFHELQQQLRQRRLVTQGAVLQSLQDDAALLKHMGKMVKDRGVKVSKEKQAEHGVMVYGSNNLKVGASVLSGSLTGNANALLNSIKGLVVRTTTSATNENELGSGRDLNQVGDEVMRGAPSTPNLYTNGLRYREITSADHYKRQKNAAQSKGGGAWNYGRSSYLRDSSVCATTSVASAGNQNDEASSATAGLVLQEAISFFKGMSGGMASSGRLPSLPFSRTIGNQRITENKSSNMRVGKSGAARGPNHHTYDGLKSYWYSNWNISSKSLKQDLHAVLEIEHEEDTSNLLKHGEETTLIHSFEDCEARSGKSKSSSYSSDEEEEDSLLVDFLPRDSQVGTRQTSSEAFRRPSNWAAQFAPPRRKLTPDAA